jgi:MFS family permease
MMRSLLSVRTATAALLALWAWRESGSPEPIVPLSLFRNRTVLAACLVTALNFFVLIGCTVLLPLSMQTVGGARPDEVALRLIALTLAVPAGAFFAGRAMLRIGHMGRLAAAGCLIACLALLGIALVSPRSGIGLALLMLPLGIGLGITLPAVIVAAQMAVGPAMVGVVTSLVAFFRSLGGVAGIAVLTSVVLAGAAGTSIATADPVALTAAFRTAFGLAAAMSGIAAVLALRIVPVPREPG